LVAFVPRLSALRGINLALALVIALFATGVLAFLFAGVLLDPLWPSIGTAAVFGSVVVGTLSEADRQRRMLREEAAHMAGEVDAARRIQMGLLPDPREAVGSHKRFDLAAMLEPARTVGGDFYDCFVVDRKLFFVVADVSGKGLPAALFMAAAKSHIQSAAMGGGTVGEMLTRAQARMVPENPESLFVTVFAAVFDPATGMLEYANAGHEPPFVRAPGGEPQRLGPPQGPPLCVIEDYEYASMRRPFAPGEWLCVVTDGATEAVSPAREFFGAERLRAALAEVPADARADDVVAAVHAAVNRFTDGAEAADDLTLLVLLNAR
jgi:serine phosphatase RsbU (regulator of sigma subunit)